MASGIPQLRKKFKSIVNDGESQSSSELELVSDKGEFMTEKIDKEM